MSKFENFRLTPFKFREIITPISQNQKYINNVDENKFKTGYPLEKYWTFDFIETISSKIDFDSINVIFDLGSRDGYQSVEFRNWFPNARIIAFEANPNLINHMHQVTNGYDIEIVNYAVGNENKITDFYIANANIGASSLLQTNQHFRSQEWPQYKTNVTMVRIDDWCKNNNISYIDILWVDVQGAERIVFEGVGDLLNNVKAICTEVEVEHMYHGSTLKEELDEYLLTHGFIEAQTFHMCPEENLTYDYLKKFQGEVDVTYINKKFIYGN